MGKIKAIMLDTSLESEFKKFIVTESKKIYNEFNRDIDFDFFIEKDLSSLKFQIIILKDNGKIVGFFTLFQSISVLLPFVSEDIPYSHLYYFKPTIAKTDKKDRLYLLEMINYLKNNLNNVIVNWDFTLYDDILSENGFVRCNCEDGDFTYQVEAYDDCFYLYNLGKNYLRDAYIKYYLNREVDISDISYDFFNTEELVKLLSDTNRMGWKLGLYGGGFPHFVGLDYFSPYDFYHGSPEDKKYLIAHVGDYVIGVIKYGIYGCENKYQSVPYTDVHINYRGKGIEEKMVEEISKHIKPDTTLQLSNPSDYEKVWGMENVFKNIIKSCKVITYAERFYC